MLRLDHVKVNSHNLTQIASTLFSKVKYRSATGKRIHVLVVDDIRLNRLIAKRALKNLSKDIDVTTASSGEKARDKVAKKIDKDGETFAVILLDNQMGPKDKNWWGEETATEIRAVERPLNVKSFIVTWSADPDRTKSDQMYKDADDLLQKPLKINELTELFVRKCRLLIPSNSPTTSPTISPPMSPNPNTNRTSSPNNLNNNLSPRLNRSGNSETVQIPACTFSPANNLRQNSTESEISTSTVHSPVYKKTKT